MELLIISEVIVYILTPPKKKKQQTIDTIAYLCVFVKSLCLEQDMMHNKFLSGVKLNSEFSFSLIAEEPNIP